MTAKKTTKSKPKKQAPRKKKSLKTEAPVQKTGRPPKFQDWWLPMAKLLSEQGQTNEEIARKLGIATSTLYKYMGSDVVFAEAIQAGKEFADQSVEDALYNRCIGYQDTDGRQYPPDIKAQEIWLRNRRRSEWADVQKVEQTTTVVHTLDVQKARQALLNEPPEQEDDPIDVEPLDG